MPKRLNPADRFARASQNRNRRRTAPISTSGPLPVVADAETAEAPVPTPARTADSARTFYRPRHVPDLNYDYVRTDLIRIGVVVAILLVVMAALYVILR